jgi:hypothetical protein
MMCARCGTAGAEEGEKAAQVATAPSERVWGRQESALRAGGRGRVGRRGSVANRRPAKAAWRHLVRAVLGLDRMLCALSRRSGKGSFEQLRRREGVRQGSVGWMTAAPGFHDRCSRLGGPGAVGKEHAAEEWP